MQESLVQTTLAEAPRMWTKTSVKNLAIASKWSGDVSKNLLGLHERFQRAYKVSIARYILNLKNLWVFYT